jgi:hypothetical protein
MIRYESGHGGTVSIVEGDPFLAEGMSHEVSISKGAEEINVVAVGGPVGSRSDKAGGTSTSIGGSKKASGGQGH